MDASLDVPARTRGLAGLLDGLDRGWPTPAAGVYFAKDSRMRPDLVPVMYRLDEWRAVRDRLDPERRITSDLARASACSATARPAMLCRFRGRGPEP